MELPNFRASGGEVLNGIKSKLGLGGDSARDARGRNEYGYDGYSDDEYQDDYAADYGEYGYQDDYAADYGEGDYADYVDASSTRRSSYDRSSSRDAMSPKLVSIDDVRARTQIPDRLNRDPLPQRHVTSSSSGAGSISTRGNRVLIDNTAPSPGSPESLRASRSAGLNSLFETTAENVSSSVGESVSAGGASSPTASTGAGARFSASQPSASFDPYDAYASSRVTAHVPERTLTVVKPLAYGDVERVAKTLRAGDVVVLSLTATPADLVKRVLDFSFGVACYANARVDCIGDKVFAIIQGGALTEAEMLSLRNQGVI